MYLFCWFRLVTFGTARNRRSTLENMNLFCLNFIVCQKKPSSKGKPELHGNLWKRDKGDLWSANQQSYHKWIAVQWLRPWLQKHGPLNVFDAWVMLAGLSNFSSECIVLWMIGVCTKLRLNTETSSWETFVLITYPIRVRPCTNL